MSRTGSDNAAIFAMGLAAALVAHHVGAKAVRDALFLSSFPINTLPTMVVTAALFSILAVLGTSRAMARFTPARLVPLAFGASSVMLVALWLLHDRAPKTAVIVLYLQIVGLGSLLASGFWSMVNERFDPRTAKKQIGRIAGAGTAGGMLGGLAAERVAANYSATMMLLVLAALHLACAVLAQGLKPVEEPAEDKPTGEKKETSRDLSILKILKEAPYLRTLALLVLLGTISAAMIDFVFKSQAVAFYGKGEKLLRFFGIFYGITGVLTFLVQTAFSGLSLGRMGLAKTVATLPCGVAAGAVGGLVIPGLGSAMIARSLEAVFRGSLFRAGYELFYTPIPTREKRAVKSIVDVGFDRMGDAVGNLVVATMLRLGPGIALQLILGAAIAVALAGIAVASRLHRAYIGALEKGLLERASDVELPQMNMGDTMMMSGILDTSMLMGLGKGSPAARPVQPPPAQQPSPLAPVVMRPAETAPAPATPLDPLVRSILEIRSGDRGRVLKILQSPEPPAAALIPHVINLLGWDQVYLEAIRALRRVADTHTGQLCDHLLDPKTDFPIRRRLPRILASATSQRAAEGLLAGLRDRRFEVRFQCGRALQVLVQKNPHLKIASDVVFEFVSQEVNVGKPVWESNRLLDRGEEKESSPFVDDFLRERANRSLEHVFTLMALTLPTDALQIAFRGLHTDDRQLRGTALEYLESVLPRAIREKLWPFLEDHRARKPATQPAAERPKQELLNELLGSNQSIMINLAELRKKMEGGGGKV